MPARLFRYLLFAALAISGVVLACRAIAGPFRILSVPVNSPLNAQSVFGLSVTALLALRRSSEGAPFEGKTRYATVWLAGIVVLAVVLLAPALGYPLVFDEYTLARYGQGLNLGMAKYYLTHAGGDGFFRPLGYLSLGLDATWAGYVPVGWHLLSFALHLGNIGLVWLLAQRLLADDLAALWAAALFAIHGTVLLTATYLAARFDALAAFFVLAGLVSFGRYVEQRSRLALGLSFGCLAAGLLSKEIAYSFPFLAVLVSGSKAKEHWRALAGLFAVVAAAFTYRYSLLGSIGGYRDPATGALDVLQPNFVGYLKGIGLRAWSVFYFPVNWSRQLEPWLVLALIASLLALCWITVSGRAPRQKLLLSLAFTILALLPIAHLLLVDAGLWGAGRFYLPLAGFAMLLAVAIRGVPGRKQVFVGTVLVLFQVAALRHNLGIWGAVAGMVDRTCTAVAQSGALPPASSVPVLIDGVPFLRNGLPACVEFRQAQARTPVR
ncbi:MAG TPA: hypothetical protein VGF16_19655 [Bryobacteraceae bacterium]